MQKIVRLTSMTPAPTLSTEQPATRKRIKRLSSPMISFSDDPRAVVDCGSRSPLYRPVPEELELIGITLGWVASS
jgi:hypothetical protein